MLTSSTNSVEGQINFYMQRRVTMDKLLDILGHSDSLPFLFIGSGFSRRYLNLPNWKDLLKHLAWVVDESEYTYAKYEQKARESLKEHARNYNVLMAKIADFIESDLSSVWYDDPKFLESRSLYKECIEIGVSPLKIEISKYINWFYVNNEFLLQEEIEYLKQTGIHSIAGIITTNYDPFLDNIFNDFTSYASQDDLVFSTSYSIGEIYKIHGCSNKPETLVINSKDYVDISKKNKYLASKLLTIFVEHPIIFVGYSLQDEDVKNILEAIVDFLDYDKLKILSSRLIFIEWDEGLKEPEFGTHTINFLSGKSLNTIKIKIGDFTYLYDVLAQQKAKYPTAVLRKLKKDIYDLVLTNDPRDRLTVLSPDEILGKEGTEYIVGFGLMELGKRGYRSIEAEEIFRDIILDKGNFNNDLLVNESLPKLLSQTGGSIPLYKYIASIASEKLSSKIKNNIKCNFDSFKNNTIMKNSIRETSIDEILANSYYDLGGKVRKIICLTEDQMNTDDLYSFLHSTLTDTPDIFNTNLATDIRRLIKMYDWLVYKK